MDKTEPMAVVAERLWIDCEFNEFKGALISMALVDAQGREWYEVVECDNLGPWVSQNVVPILGKAPTSYQEMQASLHRFLAQYAAIHVIADWPEDIKHFCDALITGPGYRLDTPPLTLEVVRIDAPSEQPHNALADARGIRDAMQALAAPPSAPSVEPQRYTMDWHAGPSGRERKTIAPIPDSAGAWVRYEDIATPDAAPVALKAGDSGWECCGNYNYNGDCCYRKMEAAPTPAAAQSPGITNAQRSALAIRYIRDWTPDYVRDYVQHLVSAYHDRAQSPDAQGGEVAFTGWTKADGVTLWLEHDGEPALRAGKHGDMGCNRAVYLYTRPADAAVQGGGE